MAATPAAVSAPQAGDKRRARVKVETIRIRFLIANHGEQQLGVTKVEKMDSNYEFQFREPLRRRGFRLHRRVDGMYEIYKGDYIRMTGELEKEIREFVAELEKDDPLPPWERDGV
jgi:hypothetical protein